MLKKGLAIYLVTCLFILGFAQNSTAMLIPSTLSQAQTASLSQRDAELQQIRFFLESKLVSQRLTDLGLTAQEVKDRLSQLTDGQVHQVAQQLDGLQTGGDSALGIIIALLVIAILVVILLHLTGHKIIVTK